jgi:hypothetical protein
MKHGDKNLTQASFYPLGSGIRKPPPWSRTGRHSNQVTPNCESQVESSQELILPVNLQNSGIELDFTNGSHNVMEVGTGTGILKTTEIKVRLEEV